jgi:hypothetical protein
VTTTNAFRVFSYGGGVQSFAVLAMQARGELPNPFDAFVMANVGDDSENPATLKHLYEVALPLAQSAGVRLEIVRKVTHIRPGETLYQNIMGVESKMVRFPVYQKGKMPFRKVCTANFKIEPINNWIKLQGHARVELGIGFSTEEAYRVERKPKDWHDAGGFERLYVYPLIEAQLSRIHAMAYIESTGLPVPAKSACWFCPFTKRTEWIEMRRNDPEQFQAAVDMERAINEKRIALGGTPVYIHRDCLPLDQAVGEQATLFDLFEDTDTDCETGYCGI